MLNTRRIRSMIRFRKDQWSQLQTVMVLWFQEQLARERTVSGRVQIQVWYHDERKELVVAVLAADDLAPRDETLGFGSLPEAYARLCLLPLT